MVDELVEQCTHVSVDHGRKNRCIREVGHPGDHAFGGPNLRVVICDSCGLLVTETARFRHRSCPAPNRIPASTLEAIVRLKERAGVR